MPYRVVIVGAGLGGLCLAQRLARTAGLRVSVLERDRSARAHQQGYRVSLKDAGLRALQGCLRPELFDLARATAIGQATRMVFMDSRLRPRFAKPIPPTADAIGVNRLTLREILLAGLDDIVEFDTRFDRFEPGPGPSVLVHTTGAGSPIVADLLVGADGTGSAVRRQLLPDAGLDQLGWAIWGRTPLTDDLLGVLPADLIDTFNRVVDDDGAAVSIATCRTALPVGAAAARHAPQVRLTDIGPYLSWTLTRPGNPPPDATAAQLHRSAADIVSTWAPPIVDVVARAEVGATFLCRISSARPVTGWTEPRVTLLGDAIHTMSPGRGDGANTALRDAHLLGDLLATAAAGTAPLDRVAHRYQREMLEYGFAAVDASRDHPFTATVRR